MDGIHDVYITEGTVNDEKFADFVKSCLLPVFNYSNSNSVVIMDNASIHHVQEVVDLIETHAGARVCFLPPYSPDLMPAKGVYSQVKSLLKQNHKLFQICSDTRAYLALAFGMITSEDCSGHIINCGYYIIHNHTLYNSKHNNKVHPLSTSLVYCVLNNQFLNLFNMFKIASRSVAYSPSVNNPDSFRLLRSACNI